MTCPRNPHAEHQTYPDPRGRNCVVHACLPQSPRSPEFQTSLAPDPLRPHRGAVISAEEASHDQPSAAALPSAPSQPAALGTGPSVWQAHGPAALFRGGAVPQDISAVIAAGKTKCTIQRVAQGLAESKVACITSCPPGHLLETRPKYREL